MRLKFISLTAASALLLSGCGLSELQAQAATQGDIEVLVQPNVWFPGLIGIDGYGASGWGPNGYPGVSTEDLPLDPVQEFLNSIGLQPEDVATGQVQLANRGDSLAGPTMDFCGVDFPSEALRLVRREIVATNSDGNVSGLSSEATQYESAEAVQQALVEIRAAVSECAPGTTFEDVLGKSHQITLLDISVPKNLEFVPDADLVVLQYLDKVNDETFRRLIVMQARGNTIISLQASEIGDAGFAENVSQYLFELSSRLGVRLLEADRLNIGEYW